MKRRAGKQLSILFRKEQHAELTRLSKAEHRPIGQLVREAVDEKFGFTKESPSPDTKP